MGMKGWTSPLEPHIWIAILSRGEGRSARLCGGTEGRGSLARFALRTRLCCAFLNQCSRRLGL